jgi:TolB-like protein
MRRNVVRVAAIYAMTAWLLTQIAVAVEAPLRLPEWFDTFIIVVVAIGFPVALVLAWAFDLTPEGMKPTTSDGGAVAAPGQSPLDFVIAGLLVVTLGSIIYTVTAQSTSPTKTPIVETPEITVLHNSIAVLPFENLSPDPDDAYFAAGIHEETLNQLAKIKDLSVIARTSVMGYAATDKKIPEIAAELNVGAVLEGSVRYEENHVRITAQLIDAKTGAHLWSEAYDRELKGIFAIQSDIALKITDAMKAEFDVGERKAIEKPPTDNFEAYAAYVKALSITQIPAASIAAVLAQLNKAIELDPNFALALGTKALFHSFANVASDETYVRTRENQAVNLSQAEALANRALAIDPNQGYAYGALVIVEENKRNWVKAYQNSERAYSLTPTAIITFQYAALSAQRGFHEKAIGLLERSIALDPQNPNLTLFAAPTTADMQAWDKAEEFSRRAIPFMPDFYLPYLQISYWASLSGDHKKALAMAIKCEALWGESRNANSRVAMMEVYQRLGRPKDVERLFGELQEIAKTQHVNAGEWARAYGALGELDRAMDYLRQIVRESFPQNYVLSLHFLPDHPYWDHWRAHPDFQDILDEIEATSR